MEYWGKTLILVGLVICLIGVIAIIIGKFNLPIGKLPGDIIIRRDNFSFYFPLTTCILISLVLTIFFYFFSKK